MYLKIGLHEFEPFTKPQSVIDNWHMMLAELPLTGLLNSIGFYILLMLSVALFALHERMGRLLIMSVPLIMTLLIIIASPVINSHPRYAFPIVYSMPFFIACYLAERRKSGKAVENAVSPDNNIG